MDIDKAWSKALKNTEIVRSRIQALTTAGDTKVPYILLSESSINVGDTVVRKGTVIVQKPSLIIPPNNPQFEGFEFDKDQGFDEGSVINFLLVRGVSFPSFRYDNKTSSLEVFEDKLSKALKHYEQSLQRQENTQAGLVVGPEDCWQFSLIIFIASQIAKNAETDIRKLLDDFHKRKDR